MVKLKKICNIDIVRDRKMSFRVELEAADVSDSEQAPKILYKLKRRKSMDEPIFFSSETEIYISKDADYQTLRVKNNGIDSSQRKRRNSLNIPPDF